MPEIVLDASAMERIAQGLRQAPELVQREQMAAMHEVTALLQAQTQDRLPAVTGVTRASIQRDVWADTAGGVMGMVGSTQISMIVLEEGAKPHMPPSEALQPWVKAVLGVSAKDASRVAFLVARKIAKHGLPARHILRDTFADMQGFVQQRFEGAAQNIADGLTGAAR